jgi:hypothetical protein
VVGSAARRCRWHGTLPVGLLPQHDVSSWSSPTVKLQFPSFTRLAWTTSQSMNSIFLS